MDLDEPHRNLAKRVQRLPPGRAQALHEGRSGGRSPSRLVRAPAARLLSGRGASAPWLRPGEWFSIGRRVDPEPERFAMPEVRRYRIREWPREERPRERMRALGPGALSTRELLAIVVGSGGVGRSAVDIAAEIMRRAEGSLRRLATMSPGALEGVVGVGEATAVKVVAALELGRRAAAEGALERERIASPRDVFRRFGPQLRDLQYEEFHVLLLNVQHRILRDVLVTRGILDTSVVHPREVFRPAIVENAFGMILVHNHPSGDPSPSPEDRRVTAQLVQAGFAVGIDVLDHVVIGDGSFVSFAEAGLL